MLALNRNYQSVMATSCARARARVHVHDRASLVHSSVLLPAAAHRRVAVARDGVETREKLVQRMLVRAHRGVLERVRGLADVPALHPCIRDRIGVGVGVGVSARAGTGEGREVERLGELLEGTHEPAEGVLDRGAR